MELDRLKIIERVAGQRLTVTDAAQQLGVSRRQMTRLIAAYKAQGPASIVSRQA